MAIKLSNEVMTSRERIYACLRGDDVDRFPVWMKIGGAWQGNQPEPYKSMPMTELLEEIGCDPMVGNGVRVDIEQPHITRNTTEKDGIRTTVITTPDGDLVEEEKYESTTRSWHPTVFMAETPENLSKLRWLYKDNIHRINMESVENGKKRAEEFREKGYFTMTGVGPSPLMDLLQHKCGPVSTVYLMYDVPELFKEIIDIMHESRIMYLKERLPYEVCDSFWLTENTSTSLHSPDMFRDIVMPQLAEYGNMVLEQDIIPVHHMCGLLNDILEMIDELPAMANEAYTTRPLGNVSLAEGRTRMPSKALIGGTNATLLLKPVEEIISEVAADLDNCPDRKKMFLTSAGMYPPQIPVEKTIRLVDALKQL